jgi:hypothetical protein
VRLRPDRSTAAISSQKGFTFEEKSLPIPLNSKAAHVNGFERVFADFIQGYNANQAALG